MIIHTAKIRPLGYIVDMECRYFNERKVMMFKEAGAPTNMEEL